MVLYRGNLVYGVLLQILSIVWLTIVLLQGKDFWRMIFALGLFLIGTIFGSQIKKFKALEND